MLLRHIVPGTAFEDKMETSVENNNIQGLTVLPSAP